MCQCAWYKSGVCVLPKCSVDVGVSGSGWVCT